MQEGSTVTVKGGGSASFVINGVDVPIDKTITTDGPLSPQFRPFARIVESIDQTTIDGWVNRLRDWNTRTRQLMDSIYAHFPS
jgi:hypothetical protein